MKNKFKQQDGAVFSFYVEMIVLIVILLAVCTILVRVFAASSEVSRQAEELNEAVFICKNAAEAFEAAGDLRGMAKSLNEDFETAQINENNQTENAVLYFDEQLACVSQEESVYVLSATLTEQPTDAGVMKEVYFSLCNQDGTEIYDLTTQRYLSNVSAGR